MKAAEKKHKLAELVQLDKIQKLAEFVQLVNMVKKRVHNELNWFNCLKIVKLAEIIELDKMHRVTELVQLVKLVNFIKDPKIVYLEKMHKNALT